MNITLRGKTAIITGADEGLAGAVAIYFASLGCSLALVGRDATKLKERMNKCLNMGLTSSQVMTLVSDLQRETEGQTAFANISEKMGAIHVLVNGTCSMSRETLSETTPSAIQDAMNANVVTSILATKQATPLLEQTNGVVINISCSSSKRMCPGLLAFSMSQAALDYFTRCAALELASKNIRVNAVSPSVNVFESLLEKPPATPFQEPRTAPLQQSPPTTDDVVQAIAFLASDESLFISGENICVDNGLHAAGLPF